MSIVEKAVDRLVLSRKNRSAGENVDTEVREVDSGRPGGVSPKFLNAEQLGQCGYLSVLDDPKLAIDFRFVKRPLLARVFGLSGSIETKGNLVLVTSDFPGAGKSFISLNLAVSIAQEQITNVLLIDADPLRRNLSNSLGLGGSPGFLQALANPNMDIDTVTLQTDFPSLRFIPAGQLQDNAPELLGRRRIAEVLGSLGDPDTVVLLDSPPLLLTSESRVLADKVDHTLIVVEAGRSTSANIDSALNVLKDVESTISFVLNKAPAFESSPEKGYYYKY